MNVRRLFLFVIILTACVVLGFLYYTKTNRPICKDCNVLILDIDTLRADELPCYGYPHDTAPNICRFAKSGITFSRNISQDNWTLPSMMSTITSLYSDYHRMFIGEGVDKLNPAIPTLASQFAENQYETYFVATQPHSFIPSTANDAIRGYMHEAYADTLISLLQKTLSEATQKRNFLSMRTSAISTAPTALENMTMPYIPSL